MQTTTPKQYLQIAGATVLQHSLDALLSVPGVEGVVVALADDDQRFGGLPASSDPRLITTTGGSRRADSVVAGLQTVVENAGEATWVLVHDAARPLITVEDIIRLIQQVEGSGYVGGLLASPVQDTLKQTADDQTQAVIKTVDRRRLWQAQTPQLFRAGELLAAYQAAINNEASQITDEASVMEMAGHTPLLVEALHQNFKITRGTDAKLAEVLLLDRLSSSE